VLCAHIRRNIASRRSEGDFGINMSKNAQPMFEACECKIRTTFWALKEKKWLKQRHSDYSEN
jgi:hypothetical protein